MHKRIFLNLPVKDLQKSIEFFTKLGYTFNPHYTDESATCMIVSDTILVMLLTEEKFKTFTPKQIVNAKNNSEMLIGLECESRSAVDEIISKAVEAGGRTYNPAYDHGFMYGQAFEDIDGHIWEHFWIAEG